MVSTSVADTGPGAFVTAGSGMGKKTRLGSYFREFFGLKYLNSLMRIQNLFDPRSGIRDEKNSDPG
jgi:hypothetical protein